MSNENICDACGEVFDDVTGVLTHDCPEIDIEEPERTGDEPDSEYYDTADRLPDDLQDLEDREVDPIPDDRNDDGADDLEGGGPE